MSHSFLKKLRLTLEMIKFEHSVFALPFALTGALLAVRESGFDAGGPGVEARLDRGGDGGGALGRHGLQPLLDADIDARNPRTRSAPPARRTAVARASPGASRRSRRWCSCCAARALNPLCFRLAPVALAVVFFYSFTKRFTTFSHLVLGFSLGIAPAAAWIAIRGSLDPRILWLTAAVTLWTAGLRRDLLLPGLRIRRAARACSACRGGSASRGALLHLAPVPRR